MAKKRIPEVPRDGSEVDFIPENFMLIDGAEGSAKMRMDLFGKASSIEELDETKYEKPEDGIPKTDLADDVQDSLGLADTALQASDIECKQNTISTDTVSSAFGDNTSIATGFSGDKLHLNIASRLWTYIQDKISSVLGLTASDYGGNAATASSATSATTAAGYTNDGAIATALSSKADKVTSATNGNFAGLDANGNLTDSGKTAADFATAAQGGKADSAIQGVSVDGTELTPDTNKKVNVQLPQASTAAPLMDGTATAGTATVWAKGDHVHPTDTSREAAVNKISEWGNSPDNTQYPGAKLVKDTIDAAMAAEINNAEYDSENQRINFNRGNTTLFYCDARPFVKDGMVDTVVIASGYLKITFNTDAGKQDISIPIGDIFDADNYYTKTEVDTAIGGKVDKVSGKGLSTNDFTSTYKTNVDANTSARHSHSTLTLSTTAQAYDGSNTLALPASDPYTSARTPTSHTHGSITNDGKIGTASGKPLITTTNGVITTGSFGTTSGTFCAGDDERVAGAVRFNLAQSLNDTFKEQARMNIGAAAPYKFTTGLSVASDGKTVSVTNPFDPNGNYSSNTLKANSASAADYATTAANADYATAATTANYAADATNVNLSVTANTIYGDSISAGAGTAVTVSNAGNAKKWDSYRIAVDSYGTSSDTIYFY